MIDLPEGTLGMCHCVSIEDYCVHVELFIRPENVRQLENHKKRVDSEEAQAFINRIANSETNPVPKALMNALMKKFIES
jgi:hypothetical protein